MGGEKPRRRRGRRRGRPQPLPPEAPSSGRGREEERPPAGEEERGPGAPSFRFRFWRRREGEREERPEAGRARPERAAPQGAVGPAHGGASPLGFWRRSQVRPYRPRPLPRGGPSRWWRRITGFYFPPWLPVIVIVLVVFGILGLLFFTREATGAPRIGKDHWHATIQLFICGVRQPNIPEWESGVQSHGDGVIHLHPFLPSEEGAGARLDKFFEHANRFLGNWDISSDSITLGDGTTYKNGDLCPDGRPGKLQVIVNDQPKDNFLRYIPQDGDRIRIVFGPEDAEPIELDDRTIIAQDQATRTVELEIGDAGSEASTAFSPASIEVLAGETVKLSVRNTGLISHGLRVAGPDGQYDTADDYVSDPEIIPPGQEAVVVVRFDEAGEFQFRDPTIQRATGTIVVRLPEEDDAAGETPPAEEVDAVFQIEMGDNFFSPAEIEVEAGQRFRIELTNTGRLVHNLHIAGPDGEYETEDDIDSQPPYQRGGETGTLVAQLDEPGIYEIRCDFHPVEMVGRIIVR